MPPISARTISSSGIFSRQLCSMRTAILAALMPKVWRSFRPTARVVTIGSRHYRGSGKAGRLGQAEHQIHVLNRLASGAFDQVVYDRDDDSGVAALRPMHGDAADVGCAHRSRLRMAAGRHHINEGLAGIALFEQR